MAEPNPQNAGDNNPSSSVLDTDPLEDPSMPCGSPDSSIWTAQELKVLLSHVAGYRELHKKEKSHYIASKVAPLIKACWGDRYTKAKTTRDKVARDQWGKKKHQIWTWFGNHAGKKRRLRIPGFNIDVKFDSVLIAEKKKEIEDLTTELSNDKPGGPRWIGCYQRAKKAIKEQLTEEEIQAYEIKVQEWIRDGVPADVQAANVLKHGQHIIHEIVAALYRSMGMRMMAFECHYDKENRIRWSSFDTQRLHLDSPSIPSFSVYNKKLFKDMQEGWKDYIKNIAKIERGADVPVAAPAQFDKQNLTFHPKGLPKIPGPVVNSRGVETAIVQQSILRQLYSTHYGLACKSAKRVPYSRMTGSGADWTQFVRETDFPAGTSFKDPATYHAQEMQKILGLWRQREERGELTFRFIGIPDKEEVLETMYPPGAFEGFLIPAAPATISSDVEIPEPGSDSDNADFNMKLIEEMAEDDPLIAGINVALQGPGRSAIIPTDARSESEESAAPALVQNHGRRAHNTQQSRSRTLPESDHHLPTPGSSNRPTSSPPPQTRQLRPRVAVDRPKPRPKKKGK